MQKSESTFLRSCLYDPYWQQLRVSFLGTFGDIDTCQRSIQRLDKYIAGARAGLDDSERALRNWRALNLLNAVLLGFGNKSIYSRALRQVVIDARDRYTLAHKEFTRVLAVREREGWDWNLVAAGLKELSDDVLWQIWNNLKKRVYTANRRKQGMTYRPELQIFLDYLKAEMVRREMLSG